MLRGERLPLVGRAAELAAALEVVRRVAARSGEVLVVEGEAGIGKTRLLDEVLEQAEAQAIMVLRAAGGQLEADLPFAPFVDALRVTSAAPDARSAGIAALLTGAAQTSTPVGPGGDGAQRRLQIVQALVDLVEELCADGPVAVAVEDAHWFDEASLAVVDRLGRRLAHLPLLLVLTARPYPRSAALHGVLDRLLDAHATHVRLQPLDDAAARDIAGVVLGAEPGDNLAAELAAAGGNPLFVTELLAALQHEGDLRLGGGRVEVDEPRIPPSLRLTVLRRLSVLPDRTTELLRMAAVLGTVFDPGELAAFVGRSVADVAAVVNPAREAGVVGEAHGRLAFRHDLVRDAVYEDIPEAVRASLHAAAARSLAEAGFAAERTAPHLLRAALRTDDATIQGLRGAAAELGARAPQLAVDLLDRALHLASAEHADRDELRVELATALGWAERPQEAAALADELLAELPAGPLRRAALLVRVVQNEFLGTGGWPEFAQPLEDAAAEPDAGTDERGRLLSLAALGRVHLADLDRARLLAQKGLDAAEQAGDDQALVTAMGARMHVAFQSFDEAHAIALARRTATVARSSTSAELQRWAPLAALALALFMGNLAEHQDEALALLRDALVRAEDRGLAQSAVNVQRELGSQLYRMGRWDEATVELEAAIDRAAELGRAESSMAEAFGRLTRIAVHRDDLPAARRWLERTDDALADGQVIPGVSVRLALARAELLAASGSEQAACDLLAETCAATPVASGMIPVLAPSLARLSVRVDKHGDIARQTLAGLPDDEIARWVRGLLDADLGQLLSAVTRLRGRGTGLREEQPMLWEDAADLLVTDGRVDEAIQLLTEALDVWEELGAARDVARVESRLRDLGVRRGRRGRRPVRPTVGWGALTDTERRVVELVAEGVLYRDIGERLFISRRTVETHVAHVFAKVGVSNRRDLEAAYAEHTTADLPTG